MRIVILTNSDVGLYKFRRELLEKLCNNHEVFIVLPNGPYIKEMESIGCKYIPFEFNRRGKNPLADIMQVKRYIDLLKAIKPALVLTYTIKPNIYGGIACQITNIPYIANITGLGTAIENRGWINVIGINLYKMGLRKAKCVFFQNKENQKVFIRKKIVCGRTELLPGSGVNLTQYKYEKYPNENKSIRFLFVGRIMKDKGIEELLTSMEKIYKKNKNVILDIVGPCEEDYTTLLAQAEKKGFVHYFGFQKNIHSFYKNCHCVVLPSYHEGLANVLLEGAATGRPVIATNVPGCQETFTEGVTGFGCELKNLDSLKQAIEKFLCLSEDKHIEMGKNARRKIEKEFNRKFVIEAYLKKIAELDN